uniref:Apple domain-containing protein n=1 Tax=Tetranychus urticae TaxID=32264 RepID=T1KP64_TETUR
MLSLYVINDHFKPSIIKYNICLQYRLNRQTPDSLDRKYNACIRHAEDRVYLLRGKFLMFLLALEPVSVLRIADIQYSFTDTKVEMEVTFLDLPHLEYIFNSKTMSLSEETFAEMMKTKANNGDECLEKLSKYKNIIKVAIYRPSDGVCGSLNSRTLLKEDAKHGQPCSVYFFPLNNLQRIKQELTLDQVHGAYLQKVGMKFQAFNGKFDTQFEIIDVIDVTKKETGSNDDITYQIRQNAKLKIDDQFTLAVPDAKTFADCYRNCHDSAQVSCTTFSFCSTDGKIDCRVSSLQVSEMASRGEPIENDPKCGIYSMSVLDNYSRKSNRKFKTQQSTAIEQDSVHSCAKACHTSSECKSFQYCYGYCSFGDSLYTDEATEYDEECMIYTPKVSERYQKTGNKIVSDVMMTETKLTLDQCASFCYELSDGDEMGCKSFNYCPKSRTESSCSLTHFSVKSPYTNTTDGGHCSNYELKVESNGKKSAERGSNKVVKGTSKLAAFGIIMMFVFVGALLGFMAPFAYSKIKRMHDASKVNYDFTWKRQNEQQL